MQLGPLHQYLRMKFSKGCPTNNRNCPLECARGYAINPRLSGCYGEHTDIDWLVSIVLSRSLDTFEQLPVKWSYHTNMFQKFMEILQSKVSSGVVPSCGKEMYPDKNTHPAFACRSYSISGFASKAKDDTTWWLSRATTSSRHRSTIGVKNCVPWTKH